jgi:hypothetical protein
LLAQVRRHHKPAWAAFATAAGRDGFPWWNGDRLASAHQTVATIASRLYQLLGGRQVARCGDGPIAVVHLLRLEFQLPRFLVALPGLDIEQPGMPLGIFHSLESELLVAQAAAQSAGGDERCVAPASPREETAPKTEWERLAPERQALLQRFLDLNVSVASAKEILGHAPTKTEQGRLRFLVKAGYLAKSCSASERDRRGYCEGRLPTGFPKQKRSNAS